MGERRLIGALAVAGVLAGAAFPIGYGLTGHPVLAFHFGAAAAGAIATTSGLVVVGRWVGRWAGRWPTTTRPVELSRLLLGLAVLCWGFGECVNAGQAIAGTIGYPALGDAICTGAAPLAVLAVIWLPRRSTGGRPGVRLGLDALLVGSAVTVAFWRFALIEPGKPLGHEEIGNAIFVLADAASFAALLLIAVRDVRSKIWPAAVGVAGHLVADVLVIDAGTDAALRSGPRLDPWPALAIWCLAWPLIAVGFVRFVVFVSAPVPDSADVEDRREAQAGQVATLVAGVIVLAVLALEAVRRNGDGALPLGTLALGVLILLLLAAREVLSTQQRLRLTAGLRAEVFRDSLTGLPNRKALTGRLAEHAAPGVVLSLDLDAFKQVNDLLGHDEGDQLLIAVAGALQADLPPGAFVARIGGDEFAVLAEGDLAAGRALAERLRARVQHALDLRAPGLGTSASVGVSRLGETGLAESAAALRAAKDTGGVQVYEGAVAAARERRLTLEHRLRRAIEAGGVHTVGQPIVDLATGQVKGFESLARWTDAELGPVSPAEFIAVAEESGLVVALGEQLLRATVEAAAGAGIFAAGLTVSVNASPIQLRVPGFVAVLCEELARHAVPPERVIIEITEAILVTEGDAALHALAELNALGVGLAIDDFGTGYSALGYLRRLPIQILKIDKSLTSSLLTEPKTAAIVDGLVRMAHRMAITVTMEGIEAEAEAERCRGIGADHGQGWLFGRPVPWTEAAALTQAR